MIPRTKSLYCRYFQLRCAVEQNVNSAHVYSLHLNCNKDNNMVLSVGAENSQPTAIMINQQQQLSSSSSSTCRSPLDYPSSFLCTHGYIIHYYITLLSYKECTKTTFTISFLHIRMFRRRHLHFSLCETVFQNISCNIHYLSSTCFII